jgi:hypothetical protein
MHTGLQLGNAILNRHNSESGGLSERAFNLSSYSNNFSAERLDISYSNVF